MSASNPLSLETGAHDHVIVSLGTQRFGLPIAQVQDVFEPSAMTRIPLAQPCVAGLINLRGKVVTALSLRVRLGIAPGTAPDSMAVGLICGGEAFALLVEHVGDVLSLDPAAAEPVPRHLDKVWRDCASAVHRTDDGLLVLLDIAAILAFDARAAA
jgi:purine-binding chemotaxis protein CheW